MPCERGGEIDGFLVRGFRDQPGFRIIKGDAELALVLAGKLAHLQRSRLRGGFPIYVPRRILGHVLANEIEIGTTASDETLPLSANQGKYLEDLVRLLDARVDENLSREGHMARLGEECKRETRGQAEAVFTVEAALIELQLQIRGGLAPGRQEWKISHALKNSWRRLDERHAAQPTIR